MDFRCAEGPSRVVRAGRARGWRKVNVARGTRLSNWETGRGEDILVGARNLVLSNRPRVHEPQLRPGLAGWWP